MSGVAGKVGGVAVKWLTAPRGASGVARAEVGGREIEVSWKRDVDGIWISTPQGTFGFDLEGELNDDGRMQYGVSRRGSHEAWAGLSFVRAGEEETLASGGAKKKGVRGRAQMPGKIVRVMVVEGAHVEKDQPLLVMEAMKMENEIRASQAGKISKVHVTVGQAVETGADLFVIDSE